MIIRRKAARLEAAVAAADAAAAGQGGVIRARGKTFIPAGRGGPTIDLRSPPPRHVDGAGGVAMGGSPMAASPMRADGGEGVSGGAVHVAREGGGVHVAHPADEMEGVIGVHVDEEGDVHVEGMETTVHVEAAGRHVDGGAVHVDGAVHVEAIDDDGEEEMTLDELERCVHLPN